MTPEKKSRLKWRNAYAEARGGKKELIGWKAKKQLAAFGKAKPLPRKNGGMR